ncbi:hypothetical protein Glove_209g133 [Diversispora epigaea]|uniref:Uncharacterized protein n=1 Tax=Diversispora epigaea TaxID=1348612 RepID=A0A397ILK4_9GLOM|nr:hypothetical protein Glove_209g133 [Diversispora epigaea]
MSVQAVESLATPFVPLIGVMKEKLDHPDSSDKNITAKKIKSTDLNDPLVLKATDLKESSKIQGQLTVLEKLQDSPYITRFIAFQIQKT